MFLFYYFIIQFLAFHTDCFHAYLEIVVRFISFRFSSALFTRAGRREIYRGWTHLQSCAISLKIREWNVTAAQSQTWTHICAWLCLSPRSLLLYINPNLNPQCTELSMRFSCLMSNVAKVLWLSESWMNPCSAVSYHGRRKSKSTSLVLRACFRRPYILQNAFRL